MARVMPDLNRIQYRAAATAIVDKGRPVPPAMMAATFTAAPTVNNGCKLLPPPTVVRVGPISVKLADWKAVKDNPAFEWGGGELVNPLVFETPLSTMKATNLIAKYRQMSRSRMVRCANDYRMAVGMMNQIPPPRVNISARTLKMYGRSGGWSTFSPEYRGITTTEPNLPSNFLKFPDSPGYWMWQELIDGKAPIAKVDPPFEDDHDWGLYVKWTSRTTTLFNILSMANETVPIVEVKLRRLDPGFFGALSNMLSDAIELIKAGLEWICDGITSDKLQQVRNYGTLYPDPTVQASMMAWQGVAQACGMTFPANATGTPNCEETAAPPPIPLPEPMSWWELNKNWLIGGGIAVIGAVVTVSVLRRRASG